MGRISGAFAALLTVTTAVTISIDDTSFVAETSAEFASFSFDTTALFPNLGRMELNFTDPTLKKLAANVGGVYTRFGGSAQDTVVYNVTGEFAEPIPTAPDFPQVYMSAENWDTILQFCEDAGLKLVYGLNAKIGRQDAAGQPTGVWNVTNIQVLLEYIKAHNQSVAVLELGNESNVFNCSGQCANLTAPQLVAEYALLRPLVQSLLPGTLIWGIDPSITGDVKGQCRSAYGADLFGFLRDFLSGGGNDLIDGITWHYYSQFQGQNDSSIAQMLSNEYQNRIAVYDDQARAVRQETAPLLPLIMGETSSYWGGGLANASNRFASGFWYLNQLGYTARQGYSVHIRQDLCGGNYGLIEAIASPSNPNQASAYVPNPDYFTHALWRLLVGARVLDAAVGPRGPDLELVRAWAFCANSGNSTGPIQPGDVTIVVSNFNTQAVNVTLDWIMSSGGNSVGVYVLTPPSGEGLDSANASLNGQPLQLQPDLSLPNLTSMAAPATPGTQIVWPALSYGFIHVAGAAVGACT